MHTNSAAALSMHSSLLVCAPVGLPTQLPAMAPLLLLEDGENLVVASVDGAPQHLAWYWNLKAKSESRVRFRERTLRVRAEEVRGEEKRLLWARLTEMYAPYEDYQERTERKIPGSVPSLNDENGVLG